MSARFAATPDVVSLAEAQALTQNQGVVTASFWCILNVLGATQQIFYLSVNEGAGGTNSRFEAQFTSGGNMQVFARAPDTDTAINVTSTGAITAGSVNHIVIVVNVVTDQVLVYINGALDSTLAAAFTNTTFDNTVLGPLNGFGGNEGGSQPSNGDLWDLCFWHRALSAAEIQTMYHARGAIVPSDVVGRMRCNEGVAGAAIGATQLLDTSAPKLLGDNVGVSDGAPTFQNDFQIQTARRRCG